MRLTVAREAPSWGLTLLTDLTGIDVGRAVRPHSAADFGYVFAVLVDTRFGESPVRLAKTANSRGEFGAFPGRSSKDRVFMADARRSVHVDDPAPPKKALFARFVAGRHSVGLQFSIRSRNTCQAFPPPPQAQPATTEKRTVDFTRTPDRVERPPFAALAHRRGSVDVSCRDFPCVAVSERFHDPPARKRPLQPNMKAQNADLVLANVKVTELDAAGDCDRACIAAPRQR